MLVSVRLAAQCRCVPVNFDVRQQVTDPVSSSRPLWIATFAVSAGVLACALVYLVAFASFAGYRAAAYVVCACAALLCLVAAWKLRDAERTVAAVDGAWLARVNLPGGDLDD